ncbi:hypothetical protein VNO78_09079 [Psophocarpus tetragonolobus]|uniref:Uncharacterized protein n=1 Tax=Psophocarpus tetragonolobus TaxID=3891 RepID=A0AAN9XTE1_PSOTE
MDQVLHIAGPRSKFGKIVTAHKIGGLGTGLVVRRQRVVVVVKDFSHCLWASRGLGFVNRVINAATLALDAGIPMRDLITSCSAEFELCIRSAEGPDVTLPKLDIVTILQSWFGNLACLENIRLVWGMLGCWSERSFVAESWAWLWHVKVLNDEVFCWVLFYGSSRMPRTKHYLMIVGALLILLCYESDLKFQLSLAPSQVLICTMKLSWFVVYMLNLGKLLYTWMTLILDA